MQLSAANEVLDWLIWELSLVYLKDKIIFSKDEEAHLKNVKILIECLHIHNLKFLLSKCELAKKQA